MTKSLLSGLVLLFSLGLGPVQADTLTEVRERGTLLCGAHGGMTGFGIKDANGTWSGFDVDLCRAVASAVLGDPTKVTFVATDDAKPFASLQAGEVDLLIRTISWTYSSDSELGLDFVAVNYFDGQGFMVKRDLGVSSAKELNGATVCVQPGSAQASYLADFFRLNNISFQPVDVADDRDAQRRFAAGECVVYSALVSTLAASRAGMPDADNHVILPEIISKEPLGPVVRSGDKTWTDVVRWTFYSLLIAEEKSITAANVAEVLAATTDEEVMRLLGISGDMGTKLGLDNAAFRNAIAAVGNYGEIFSRNIGEGTSINLARGLNALWTQGGLQYAPPFR